MGTKHGRGWYQCFRRQCRRRISRTPIFATKGRFGPHNTNLEYHLPDVEKQGDLIYLTYFNAGLRLYDVKDPQLPKEAGWFIPPPPLKRYGLLPYDKLVSQTEDVLVDTRGDIYITDKNWGLFIILQTIPVCIIAA